MAELDDLTDERIAEERWAFEWVVDSLEEADHLVESLRDDHAAKLEIRERRGIAPIPPLIVGAVAAVIVAREMQRMACQANNPIGVILDRTASPLKITKSEKIPAGKMLVITAEDERVEDICDMGVVAIIRAALRPFRGGEDTRGSRGSEETGASGSNGGGSSGSNSSGELL